MGKSKGIIGTLTSLLLAAGIGVAIWYFIGQPENVAEAKEGLGDAYNRTKDQIDNFDFEDAYNRTKDQIGRFDFGDVLDSLDGFDWRDLFNDDPYTGNTNVTGWQEKFIERDDGGLHLTIVNSLSAEWQDEFDVAVADWSESSALTLTVEDKPVDDAWDNEKKCERQADKMVVCNGNFGETGWLGICETEIMNGRIISAVAKMNEYYLNNGKFAERRFTMCHEIGHGFGLPHTDENFYNANLGNCLDYTNRPEDNVEPGEVNFEKLEDAYLDLEEERERKLLRRGRVEDNMDGSD